MKSVVGSSDAELEERLDYLIKQMEYLCSQQAQTAQELKAIQRERSKRKIVEVKFNDDDTSTERGDFRDWMTDDEDYERVSDIKPEPSDSTHRLYTGKYAPRVGDKVQIKNPSAGQTCEGIIDSFCKDGKPKIRTSPKGPLVIRTQSNLECISRGSGKVWSSIKSGSRC